MSIPDGNATKQAIEQFLRTNAEDKDVLFTYYETIIHNIQPESLELVFSSQSQSFLEFFSTKPDIVVSNLKSNEKELDRFASLFLDASDKMRTQAIEQSLRLLKGNPKEPARALNLMLKCLVKKFDKPPLSLEKCVSMISQYHDSNLSEQITSQAAVILARLVEISPQLSLQALDNEIENCILQDSPESLTMAFSTLSVLFHINSRMAGQLFLNDYIQKKQFSIKNLRLPAVMTTALELLSAAFVNKECRASIANNFGELIKQVFEEPIDTTTNVLAAGVLIKIKANSESAKKEDADDIVELSSCIEDYLPVHGDRSEQHNKFYGTPLEVLAYTTLLQPVKLRVIENKRLMNQIIDIVSTQFKHPPWIYCSLNILVNLTMFPPKMTQEQQKLRELKNYAGKTPLDSVKDEDESAVSKRCAIVMDTGITSIISKHCPRFTQSSQETAAVLLRNLVTSSSLRTKFVQQGGLAALLYLYVDKENSPRLDAAALNVVESGLAKTLISVNPSLAFSQKLSPQAAIRPLVDLLMSEESQVPLLDTFESLLALTNIASFDEGCRVAIIREAWTKIENLLISTNKLVQRAAIELLCNLSMSPAGGEKFLDGSIPATSRLTLLAALTDLEDELAQRAAAGALAMLSEWQTPTLGRNEKVAESVVALLSGKEEEMLSRACVLVSNICSTEDEESLKVLSSKGIKAAFASCIKTTALPGNAELLKECIGKFKKVGVPL